jgi:N-acetylmuramoyl-L-alanine amidase
MDIQIDDNFQIGQCMLTKNPCYISGKSINPIGIMYHDTAKDNPFLNRYLPDIDQIIGDGTYPNSNRWGNHWNQSGLYACVHAFIGKDRYGKVRVYQSLPFTYQGWHSGYISGYLSANKLGYIGFEICADAYDDPDYLKECYDVAAQFCAYLVKKYDIPLENIIDHQTGHSLNIASNHADVKLWWNKHGRSIKDARDDIARLCGLELQILNYKVSNSGKSLALRGTPTVALKWIGSVKHGTIIPGDAEIVSDGDEQFIAYQDGWLHFKYIAENDHVTVVVDDTVEVPIDDPIEEPDHSEYKIKYESTLLELTHTKEILNQKSTLIAEIHEKTTQ